MKYIVHIGVELNIHQMVDDKQWYILETDDGYLHEWRLRKDGSFEIIAGTFENSEDALLYAKKLYVSVLFMAFVSGIGIKESGCEDYETSWYIESRDGDEEEYFKKEKWFLGREDKIPCFCGPSVWVVNEGNDDYKQREYYISVKAEICYAREDIIRSILNLDMLKRDFFVYSRKSQKTLYSMVVASSCHDNGMKMTIYCGILEHLAPQEKKTAEEQLVIKDLIDQVKATRLSHEQIDQMVAFLNGGVNQSAKQRCTKLAQKYAKEKYGIYETKKIISRAYTIRSMYSHGTNTEEIELKEAIYMKYVVLDIICGVFSN